MTQSAAVAHGGTPRMQGSSNGPLATLLMLIPLVAVPLLAIVGVPQFSPLAASQSDDEAVTNGDQDTGLGESARFADSTSSPSLGKRAGLHGGEPSIDASRRPIPKHLETSTDPFLDESAERNPPVTRELPETSHEERISNPPEWSNESDPKGADAEAPGRGRSLNGSRRASNTAADRIAESEDAALSLSDEELSAPPEQPADREAEPRQLEEFANEPERKHETAVGRTNELDERSEKPRNSNEGELGAV
ncbi:MAG: hypothetical protein AB7O26_05665, partial [Planctomycetaceae bacterium]